VFSKLENAVTFFLSDIRILLNFTEVYNCICFVKNLKDLKANSSPLQEAGNVHYTQ
jgi:hypothetical protein